MNKLIFILILFLIFIIIFLFILSYFYGGILSDLLSKINSSTLYIPNLEGKNFIITGGYSGIGLSTSIELYKYGANVIIIGRNIKKGTLAINKIRKTLGSGTVEFYKVDLSDFKNIRDFATYFVNSKRNLDGLILNAGVMGIPFKLKYNIEYHFLVNHLSHFYLTKLLINTLSTNSRIVIVSSDAHYQCVLPKYFIKNVVGTIIKKNYNSIKYYEISKFANVLFSLELSNILQKKNVYVNSTTPGIVNTNLFRYFNKNIQNYIGKFGLYILQQIFKFFILTPEQGAVNLLYLATHPNIKNKKITGKYLRPQGNISKPSLFVTDYLSKDFYKFSENLINKIIKKNK